MCMAHPFLSQKYTIQHMIEIISCMNERINSHNANVTDQKKVKLVTQNERYSIAQFPLPTTSLILMQLLFSLWKIFLEVFSALFKKQIEKNCNKICLEKVSGKSPES